MAKRLTREMADDAANELAKIAFDKKIELAEKQEKEFGDYIITAYMPKPLQGVMKEYRSWFTNMRASIGCVDASGIQKNLLYIRTNLLVHYYLSPTKIAYEDYMNASQLFKRVESLKRDRSAYINKVSDALMQLRSEKRIKEAFPEALPYLNFTESVALVPQFEELRAMLK